jgi:hypothetical protein
MGLFFTLLKEPPLPTGPSELRRRGAALGSSRSGALGLTNTPYVMANGLSSVTPEKLQKTIDAMVSAYQLPVSPQPATVYTDRFLPPPAERMPPKGMN